MKRYHFDKPLLPVDQSNRNHSAIIAGAGAVENAWSPILRALEPYHDFPLTPDGANSFLARIVYLLRWYALSPGEFAAKALKDHLEFLRDVKSSIIRELVKAERKKEIKARPSLRLILQRLIFPYSPHSMLVTTNWDRVIGKAMVEIIKADYRGWIVPLHIHGDVSKLSTMYLPSEVTKEPYRSNRHEQEIGRIHGAVMRGLEGCHRVVLYGLSIDPLDAELCQTLAAGWSNQNLKEILIVDPSHEMISHRVNLLLDRRRDVSVLGLNATTLEQEADYTVWRHRDDKG